MVLRGRPALVRLARGQLPAAVAGRWVSLLRPSFWLRAPGDDEPVAGQLGGVPVLQDDLRWPRWDRYGPLTFIAEIACGQLPSDPLALPRTGTLSFFVQDELPTAGGRRRTLPRHAWSTRRPARRSPNATSRRVPAVRAENLVRGRDQQVCSPGRPAVMITDHVPAIRVPPDHAGRSVAAAVPE